MMVSLAEAFLCPLLSIQFEDHVLQSYVMPSSKSEASCQRQWNRMREEATAMPRESQT